MRKKILKLCIVLACMIVIFFFSADTGDVSTGKSDSFILNTYEFLLHKKIPLAERDFYIEKYVVIVRKGAHFFLYFLFGLSMISFLREIMILDKRILIMTILLVFLYACSDEIHQLFVPGRNGEIRDVLLDTIGGFVSSFLYYICVIKQRKKDI